MRASRRPRAVFQAQATVLCLIALAVSVVEPKDLKRSLSQSNVGTGTRGALLPSDAPPPSPPAQGLRRAQSSPSLTTPLTAPVRPATPAPASLFFADVFSEPTAEEIKILRYLIANWNTKSIFGSGCWKESAILENDADGGVQDKGMPSAFATYLYTTEAYRPLNSLLRAKTDEEVERIPRLFFKDSCQSKVLPELAFWVKMLNHALRLEDSVQVRHLLGETKVYRAVGYDAWAAATFTANHKFVDAAPMSTTASEQVAIRFGQNVMKDLVSKQSTLPEGKARVGVLEITIPDQFKSLCGLLEASAHGAEQEVTCGMGLEYKVTDVKPDNLQTDNILSRAPIWAKMEVVGDAKATLMGKATPHLDPHIFKNSALYRALLVKAASQDGTEVATKVIQRRTHAAMECTDTLWGVYKASNSPKSELCTTTIPALGFRDTPAALIQEFHRSELLQATVTVESTCTRQALKYTDATEHMKDVTRWKRVELAQMDGTFKGVHPTASESESLKDDTPVCFLYQHKYASSVTASVTLYNVRQLCRVCSTAPIPASTESPADLFKPKLWVVLGKGQRETVLAPAPLSNENNFALKQAAELERLPDPSSAQSTAPAPMRPSQPTPSASASGVVTVRVVFLASADPQFVLTVKRTATWADVYTMVREHLTGRSVKFSAVKLSAFLTSRPSPVEDAATPLPADSSIRVAASYV